MINLYKPFLDLYKFDLQSFTLIHWGEIGNILGREREHFGERKGTFWGRIGNIFRGLGRDWEHFKMKMGYLATPQIK